MTKRWEEGVRSSEKNPNLLGPHDVYPIMKQIMALKLKSNPKPQLKFEDNVLDDTNFVPYHISYEISRISYIWHIVW